MVHALRVPTFVKRIPTGAFVGVDRRQRADAVAHDRAGIAFIGDDERQRATLALAHDNHALALAGLVRLQAAVLAIFAPVLGLAVTAEPATVDLDDAVKLDGGLGVCHRFAQLVGEHECGLILAVQVAAQLKRGNALRPVHEDHDRGE